MLVTNNKVAIESGLFGTNTIEVEGAFRDVLLKVRDLVYDGYELKTHPLFASIRMIFSPVRSVILSDEKIELKENEYSMNLIGETIVKYDLLLARRSDDVVHYQDYEYVDFELLKQAQVELSKFV